MAQQIIVGDRNSCRCDPPPAANIPGVPGNNGANGAAGAPGSNAWASLTADFTMPLQGANGVAELDHTDWLTPGEPLFVEFLGTLLVVSIAGLNVTLQNLQDGSGAYPLNAAPGTIAPATSRVTPTGFEGAAGSIGGGAAGGDLTGTYPNPTLKNTGTAGTVGDSTHVARITTDTAGRVTAATAVAIAFPATSIPSGVLNAQYAPNDGNLINGESLWATATGQQTKTAANARLALGIGGMIGPYVFARHRENLLTTGGLFAAGGTVTVPINELVYDGGIGVTLAGNALHLPTGTYRMRAVVVGAGCNLFRAWLFNISDGVTVPGVAGTNASSDGTTVGMDQSFVNGRFTVTAGPKDYRLEARCQTNGTFGTAVGYGDFEVYATWELEQEA